MSMASRPQTPILKLDDINLKKNKNQAKDKNGAINMNNSRVNLNNGGQSFPQSNNFPVAGSPLYGNYPMNYIDPNFQMAQNYAQMYHMKVMEDVLKGKSE